MFFVSSAKGLKNPETENGWVGAAWAERSCLELGSGAHEARLKPAILPCAQLLLLGHTDADEFFFLEVALRATFEDAKHFLQRFHVIRNRLHHCDRVVPSAQAYVYSIFL